MTTATAYLGLGSNLGDRLAMLRAAVAALESQSAVNLDVPIDAASIYESASMGGPTGQPDFFNTVLRVRTTLTPFELLDLVLGIESALGRVRGPHWGSRLIDIDLLLFGEAIVNHPRLVVPHPRMHERGFVMEPLRELAPGAVYPVLGMTIDELAARIGVLDCDIPMRRVMGPEWCAPANV